MKNFLKHFIALLLLSLVFGFTVFTPENAPLQNEEVSSCYIYNTDLSITKWNEIAGPHGYSEYIILDGGSFGHDHIISAGSYNGDWGALMNCMGLPASTSSIIIADDICGG